MKKLYDWWLRVSPLHRWVVYEVSLWHVHTGSRVRVGNKYEVRRKRADELRTTSSRSVVTGLLFVSRPVTAVMGKARAITLRTKLEAERGEEFKMNLCQR